MTSFKAILIIILLSILAALSATGLYIYLGLPDSNQSYQTSLPYNEPSFKITDASFQGNSSLHTSYTSFVLKVQVLHGDISVTGFKTNLVHWISYDLNSFSSTSLTIKLIPTSGANTVSESTVNNYYITFTFSTGDTFTFGQA